MKERQTRATRAKRRQAAMPEKHHYTDRTSQPVRSNAPTHNPGNSGDRGEWGQLNTNAQLRRGGISSYYRSRERGIGSVPATTTLPRDNSTNSYKHLIK